MQQLVDAPEPLQTRELFGGAVQMALPARFMDVSDVRPVPDNQEVWADASTDQSVVVEILEYSSSVSDSEAGPFFFRDLAEASEATGAHLESCVQLEPAAVPGVQDAAARILVTGTQTVGKERESGAAANHVRVLVAALRMPTHGTDLLLVLNSGADISEGSSAARAAGAGRQAAAAGAPALMAAMLRSLAVRDYGLFGGGGDGEAL